MSHVAKENVNLKSLLVEKDLLKVSKITSKQPDFVQVLV